MREATDWGNTVALSQLADHMEGTHAIAQIVVKWNLTGGVLLKRLYGKILYHLRPAVCTNPAQDEL